MWLRVPRPSADCYLARLGKGWARRGGPASTAEVSCRSTEIRDAETYIGGPSRSSPSTHTTSPASSVR